MPLAKGRFRATGGRQVVLDTIGWSATPEEGRRPMRRVRLLAALAVTAAGVAVIAAVTQAGVGSADENGVKVPAAVLPQLAARAYQMAAAAGDKSPSSVRVVRTTMAQATRVTEPGQWIPRATRSQPVYLIIESGHFVPSGVPAPPGGTLPSGPDLEIIISARSMAILTYGIGRGSPRTPTVTLGTLRSLGPVSALAAPLSH